jgi:hypothetical protein
MRGKLLGSRDAPAALKARGLGPVKSNYRSLLPHATLIVHKSRNWRAASSMVHWLLNSCPESFERACKAIAAIGDLLQALGCQL